MVKLKNNFTFKFSKAKHAHKTVGPSLTVPDMSFTLEEILHKFTRGIDPMLSKVGSYEFEGEVDNSILEADDLDMSDLTSIDEAMQMLKEIDEHKKTVQNWIKNQTEIQPTAQNTIE